MSKPLPNLETQHQRAPWIRLLKNLGANVLGQGVTVLFQVVNVPLLIHFWGLELYGEWLILTSIPGYFALSDLGFGTAATNEMTVRVAQGDRTSALSVFQSTALLINIVAVFILLGLFLTLSIIPVERLLRLSHLNHLQVSGILLIMVMQILVGQQAVFLVSGFQCDGNYALGVLYVHFIRLLEFIALASVVSLGASPLGAALADLGATAIGILGMWFTLRKSSPWIIYGYSHASFANIQRLISPAFAFISFPLGQALSLQGVVTLIGILLGPLAVVVFVTQRTLSRLAWQFLNVITNSVKSELSIAFGIGDLHLARLLHRRSCKVAVWLALAAVIILAVAGEWLIKTWTNQQVTYDRELFYLLLVIVIANSLWNTSQAVPIAINRHQQIAIRYLVSTALALGFVALLVPWWDLKGAAIALLLIDVIMSIYVVNTSLTLLEENIVDFLTYIATPPTKFRSLLKPARG